MDGCEKRGRLDAGAFLSMVEALNPGAMAAVMPKAPMPVTTKSTVQQEIVDAARAKRARKAARLKSTLPLAERTEE